jgi:DNA-binding transcriptional ArsR family regulator
VPLSAGSIRKTIDALAAILEDAIEDEYIEHNHARGKRMRVHVPKPKRTFLEIDELAAPIDAASGQDTSLDQIPTAGELGLTAMMIAQLFAQGKPPIQIARQLKLAKSTVSYHLSRLGLQAGRGYAGRRQRTIGRKGSATAAAYHPHTLRRTYISIALIANNFDVKWVMNQVGHADSKMTLDVYAQLEQRVDRSHGTSFDALIRGAREQAGGPAEDQACVTRHRFGTGNGTKAPEKAPKAPTKRLREKPKNRPATGGSSVEPTVLNANHSAQLPGGRMSLDEAE